MSYSGATTAQQAQVNTFTTLLRSACVQLQGLNKTVNALNAAWNANVLGILGSPQGTVINDNTSYAGAVAMTDTQVTQLIGILQAMQSSTMTAGNQTAITLAIGPQNML